ncbi:MAG: hypothetical protein GY868_15745 [Deltaproteobacteria bacterium]|nr:hypothetical protein [Deltaproteobacteria bacterium]
MKCLSVQITFGNGERMITGTLNETEKDGVCPLSESQHLFNMANDPKELVILEGAKHYEVYEGAHFEQPAGKALELFQKHLF